MYVTICFKPTATKRNNARTREMRLQTYLTAILFPIIYIGVPNMEMHNNIESTSNINDNQYTSYAFFFAWDQPVFVESKSIGGTWH